MKKRDDSETPVWWLRYHFPLENRSDKRIAAKWPPGVKGWCTGQSDTHEVWCARVQAATVIDAFDLVRGMYGALRSLVCFDPDPGGPHPATWWPNASRFPR